MLYHFVLGNPSTKAPGRTLTEIRRLVSEIEAAPRRHGPWRHGTRRHRARRFPYAVIFAERLDRLHLVAVAHVKRQPDYWCERLP